MWEKYGYVVASEYRKRLVMALSDNPKTPKQLSKETGIYLSHVSFTLKELAVANVVTCLTPSLRRGKIYGLTEQGKVIAQRLLKSK